MIAVPAAPVRRKPNHRSEMVNQLLFGETVLILKEKGTLWVKIRSMHDEYEGWMTRTLLYEITAKQANAPANWVTSEFLNQIVINNIPSHIPLGSSLPGLKKDPDWLKKKPKERTSERRRPGNDEQQED